MALRQQQRVKDASSEGGMDSVQRSSTGLHRLHSDCCGCTRNIRRAVSAKPHLAPSPPYTAASTPPIHTREKGGKAVQCTRALMNVKHFEEERRRSRPNAQIVFLTGGSILVMAMLVLRLATRSVSAISGHLPIACP